jgi:FkbM family methyltransferase
MLDAWSHSVGLDWRFSLLQECWFYFRACRNWRAVIQARRRNTPLSEFVLRNGARIRFVGPPPWQIFQEIWRYKQYTPPFFHGPAPRTVVDIGANIGIFALYARQQWAQARIVAFEPAPENFGMLQENVRTSPGREIEIRRAAIAGGKGTTTFYLKQESGWHALFGEPDSERISVETLGLAELMQEHALTTIDFLKLDCEGAEYSILDGNEKLLKDNIRRIAMEYHEIGGHRVQEIEATLERAGYSINKRPQSLWQTGLLYAHNPNMRE